MQLKVLILENLDRLANEISEKISQHINNMNDTESEDEPEQRRISRLINGDDEEPKRIPFNYVVDTAQYYKVSDFFFRKDSCSAIYTSAMEYKGSKTMVVVIDGMDYTALYDEIAYQELIKQFKD